MMSNGKPAAHERTDAERTTAKPHRIIGALGSERDGPLLIVVAGTHGNEPAGVVASQRIFQYLSHEDASIRGRIVAITGNLEALARGERYVDRDLNRVWHREQVERLQKGEPIDDDVEQSEQRAVIDVVESEIHNRTGPVILLDLHTTSAEAAPFCIMSDTLQNRRIAFAWSVPVILGLEEAISGTIQEYYGERGFVTAAVEGGQHRDPETVDRLESTLWIALVAGGFLRAEQVAQLGEHRLRLRSFTRGLPSVVEVVHRHGREDGDGFQMKDGFRNFSTIKRGQVVARDRRGDIRSDVDGMLILPSYQSSGDDGFFVGRRVRRIWLRISAIVRRLHLHRLLPLLPGVRQHPDDPMALVANPKITRWAAVKVFHLFGLRRYAQEGGCLVFRRRREQIVGGKSVSEP